VLCESFDQENRRKKEKERNRDKEKKKRSQLRKEKFFTKFLWNGNCFTILKLTILV